VFVFDSSAFINGRRFHFLPSTFPSVWALIEEAIGDERIIVPREVFRELTVIDDDTAQFIKANEALVVEPSERVQRRAGEIGAEFSRPGIRNRADPFVLAEAEIRGFTVVTYEGTTFSGARARRWERSMPAICQRFEIPCCTLPQALERLGLSL
jgi:hypothetical protein